VGDGLAEVSLSSLLHLAQDHGGDFLGGEVTLLATVLDVDSGLAILVVDLERPVLHVLLHVSVVELTSDETLGVEDSVLRVGVEGVFGGVTDETFLVVEGNP
jgi:hypothetical protein